MTAFKKVLRDPHSAYKLPKAVLADDSLSKEQKLKVLKQWEYDARQLLVAEEENMQGDSSSMLQRVLHAIRELDPTYDGSKSSGDKHGE